MGARGYVMSERLDTARGAWGAPTPDWIEALVRACDESSQNNVARRLGYSGAVVSQVLRNRYPGDIAGIERLVRANLMLEKLSCPALGVIKLSECLKHRASAEDFVRRNPLAVQMRRACLRCPIHTSGDDDGRET